VKVSWRGHTTREPLTHRFNRLCASDDLYWIEVINYWYDIHDIYVNDVRMYTDRRVQDTPELIRRIKAMAMLTNG